MTQQSDHTTRREQTIQALKASRLIASLRFPDPEHLPEVAGALIEAGVKFVEISVSTPMAATIVGDLKSRFAGRVFVGAGGVTGMAEAEQMLEAGAAFVSTPIVAPTVVARCRGGGAVSMIGAFTPTECFTAQASQADFVQIFPAGGLGPGYLSVLRMSFPRLSMIPSGGVTLESVSTFLRAGAAAVVVGSRLIPRDALENQDWAAITENARPFVAATVRSAGREPASPSTGIPHPGEDTHLGGLGG